jgi:DnaD/phage-associated family protein
MSYKLLSDKNFVISSNIIKNIDKDLTLSEFLIILYYLNNNNSVFDADKISESFNMSLDDVMTSFNSLLSKELIELKQGKDLDGRLEDFISIDKIYEKVMKSLKEEDKVKEEEDIFDMIAKEFDRKLTPTDFEIINAWLTMGTSKEMIIGALKEASYNGVKTLKFIDQKIYEWNKKGLKTMDDVNNYMKSKDNSSMIDLSEIDDIDWLNDDE